MRRLLPLTVVSLGLAAGGFGAAPALAQDGTPAPSDATFAATLGLPELAITVTDDGFEGVPEETEAGRYLVTFANEGSSPAAEDEGGPTSVGFVRLPDGRSLADLMPEPAAASAAEEEEFDPAAFAWLYETYVAGGAAAEPGATGQAIVDLRPGEYLVWADDPESLRSAPTLTVTGEMPADLPEPDADVTVTEVGTAEGYAFEVEGEFAPGLQVVAIVNKSDQPHFLELARLPVPLTEEQLMQLFALEEGAAPPPGFPEFDFDQIALAGYAPSQSPGSTQWTVMNLQPATHWLACWVPDPAQEGIPHAMEGMIDLIEVAA